MKLAALFVCSWKIRKSHSKTSNRSKTSKTGNKTNSCHRSSSY
jgi:hypothetical protein